MATLTLRFVIKVRFVYWSSLDRFALDCLLRFASLLGKAYAPMLTRNSFPSDDNQAGHNTSEDTVKDRRHRLSNGTGLPPLPDSDWWSSSGS